MGLIKAAMGAIGSTLGDSWLDSIRCENLEDPVLMVKKTTKNGIISAKSRIIVNPGQIALLVDNGRVADATVEPGEYNYDESSSPSFFAGQWGASFKEMWERFKYNGLPAREQAVYFFNAKEIMGNKFGTPAPVPYKDWGHPNFNPRNNTMYPMAVNVKAFGSFTFRISNPFAFMENVSGTAERYTKEMLGEQIRSEFLAVFKNTLAELGSDNYKVDAMDLPHKDDEVIQAMHEKGFDSHLVNRGISIQAIAVESIKFDEESEKKIRDYELSDAYTQSGYLAGATGRALEGAAANEGGAMTGFMGVGMAQGAAGNANASLNDMMARQSAQAASSAKSPTWNCPCGETGNTGAYCMGCGKAQPSGSGEWTCADCGHDGNTGKFCADCGKPRPANKPEDGTWLCECGSENKGKFCADCGKPMPAGARQYRCDKCGWEPADKTNPPKFCQECGDPFDENDIVE